MVEFKAREVQHALVHRTQVQTVQSAFNERIDQAAATNPVIKEAVESVGPRINQFMADFIKLSAQGPQVVLYLHEHPEETARLAKTNPYLAIAELGQIAGKAAASAPASPAQPQQQAHKSNAPAPVKPVVNNGSAVEVPLDKKPIDEFMRERNEKQYGRRGR